MGSTISVDRDRLVSLLGSLAGYPNPDDPDDPDNPGGPRITPEWVQVLGQGVPWVLGPGVPWLGHGVPWVLGNPVPWALGPHPEPWLVFGPSPEPWQLAAYSARYAGLVAALLVGSALQTHATARAMGEDLAERSLDSIRQHVFQVVDDYCGTPPRHVRLPSPWPFPKGEPRPLDLVSAGLAFQHGARSVGNEALGGVLGEAAQRLLDRALNVG
jgi:hypothetical protein